MIEEKDRAALSARRVHVGLGALVLGILGDGLLLAWPDWGLNVSLFVLVGLLLLALIVREHRMPVSGSARLFLGVAGLFAACFLWRDAPALKLLNAAIVLGAIGLAARVELGPGLIPATRLGSYVKLLGMSAVAAVGVPFSAVPGLARWISTEDSGPRGKLLGVLRGLVIAGALFFVFGVLFVSADENFARVVRGIFTFDIESLGSHLFGLLFWTWCGAAFLMQVLEPRHDQRYRRERVPQPKPSRALELNLSLALLNGLFLSFVLIQLTHLFGGHEHVVGESGLTYADYARGGFFELAWVAGLALLVLLVWESMLQEASRGATIVFRSLGGTLVLLVMVIIASAMHRMALYTEAYGLTTLRLYVSAFMIWMVCVFLWFAFTMLRGKAQSFAPGFIASGLVAALLLQAINPEERVAEHDIARLAEGKSIDHEYLLTLSDDALPVLIEHAASMYGPAPGLVVESLKERWRPDDSFDWRSWNWGRSQARAALAAWLAR